MEDDNELELSLGLYCGGSSAKSKGKVGNSSDSRIDEGDKGNKIVDDFKNFFQAGIQKQDSGTGSQKNDQVKPQENFFNNLIKTAEVVEEKGSEVNNKRKLSFDGMNQQKKLDKDSNHADFYDQARTSHISITTEDGSTAENDVADSEVDGSTSRMTSSHTSEVPKETRRCTDSSVAEVQGQKRFNIPTENEFKLGNLTYGAPHTVQHLNMMGVPYSLPAKESNPVGATGSSAYPLNGMIHMMPSANGDRPMNFGDLPQAFGYSPVQLPVLDKDHSWGLAPHSQQLHPSFVGRGAGGIAPNSGKSNDGLKISQVTMQVPPPNLSEALLYGERGSEAAKGDGKNYASEEGSSSHKEGNMKINMNFRTKETSDRPTTAVLPHEGSSIRPGAAADLKFGGCGSYPNLPWVSTTAPGPNGRTISGVTYRFTGNQIRIVCACHGSHMSPEEFVRHASEDPPNPDAGNGIAAFPSGNPATSAQT